MKFYNKSLFVIILSFFMLSFSEFEEMTYKIVITKSSEELEINEFVLKDGKTQLFSKNGEVFYVKVTSKSIKGKSVDRNYKKIKRKGIEYRLTYIYEYESGPGKRQKFNQTYWFWDDGDITELRNPERVNVGRISLKTKLK